jgi:hypothetical protein
MTLRFRWLVGIGFAASFAAGCSSSSSGTPATPGDDGSIPVQDAGPAAMCDAVSLAPVVEAGAAACFECQATQCVSEIAACSTDCTCAPAYGCLEQKSTGGSINSGYSSCTDAVDALMNGNTALMNVADCASAKCHPDCFGDGG